MRQSTIRFGLMLALMLLPLLRASALTVEIQLNPANSKQQKFAFQITSADRDGMQQFGVTVTAKTEKLSPGLLARLHLSDGKSDFAMVPVEETREGAKVTYWFRVAPNLVAKTRFEFDVLNGAMVKDGSGKMRFVALPGSLDYWFYLGDFMTPQGAISVTKFLPIPLSKTKVGTVVGTSRPVL
jgi:hypothetical protein